MSRQALSIALFTCSVVALAIAVYQFTGSRIAEGVLSVVFSIVFLVGGVSNRRRSA
jgi:hypothetical protein